MVSTQDFESCDPSSNLGGTFCSVVSWASVLNSVQLIKIVYFVSQNVKLKYISTWAAHTKSYHTIMVCIGGVLLWFVSGVYDCCKYRGVRLWCISGVYCCGMYRGVRLWYVSGCTCVAITERVQRRYISQHLHLLRINCNTYYPINLQQMSYSFKLNVIYVDAIHLSSTILLNKIGYEK